MISGHLYSHVCVFKADHQKKKKKNSRDKNKVNSCKEYIHKFACAYL